MEKIESVLIDEHQLKERVEAIGAELTDYYKDSMPIVVCVLKGSLLFFADLVRAMKIPLEVACIRASSYGSGTQSSGKVTVSEATPIHAEGRRVLLVEDIVDSGNTIKCIRQWFEERGASDIHIVSLLDKPERREVDVVVDYVGFEIPDAFVVGYGLDYDQRYRNLPYIGILDTSAITQN